MSGTLVVDLCGTIVTENTTHGFLRSLASGPFRGAWVAFWLSRLGIATTRLISSQAHRRLLLFAVWGLSRSSLEQAADRYAAMALATKARPSVMRAIQRAREFGARVVLASASIDVVVESFAKRLDARGHVATRLEYRAGKATGRILHDCTGRKLADLEAAGLITDAPFDVVTDNAEDVDLLGRAECSTFIGPESE